MAAASAFVEPEVLAVGRERLRDWSTRGACARRLRALLRRSLPPRRAHALVRGRGGARARSRRLLGAVRRLQRARRQRPGRSAGRAGRRRVGRGHAGLDRRAAREPRPCAAAQRLGELRRRLPRRAERPRRELATAVKQAVFSARVRRHDSSLAASLSALERPARGLRQPDRDLRGEPADVAPVLARCDASILGVERLRPTTCGRPLGEPLARCSRTSSASSGSASRSLRSATRTSRRSGAAASRSAGSTSTRRPGRWAARSRPERPGRRPSS